MLNAFSSNRFERVSERLTTGDRYRLAPARLRECSSILRRSFRKTFQPDSTVVPGLHVHF